MAPQTMLLYTNSLARELEKYAGVNVILDKNTFSANPFHFLRLATTARKNCDIIHVQGHLFGLVWRFRGIFTPLVYVRLCLPKRKRVITTLHEVYARKGRSLREKLTRTYERVILYFVRRYSDLAIVHTEGAARVLRGHGFKDVVVIPHGTLQEPIILDSAECKQKLGLGGKKVLTIFGYVDQHKGYETVLKILPQLGQDVVLLVAGGAVLKHQAQYLEQLRQQAARNPQLKVTGYVEDKDVPVVFNASDVVLFPYTTVSQSGPLHIALAYRRPVVTFDLPAFREIRESYGCIEIAGSESELLSRIRELLNSPEKREQLAEKAQEFWRQRNWRVVAEKHFHVYQGVLAKGKV